MNNVDLNLPSEQTLIYCFVLCKEYLKIILKLENIEVDAFKKSLTKSF